MSDIAFLPALELARRIRQRELSAVEALQSCLQRLERVDNEINAVVVRDGERALKAAQAADEALARGDTLGPLHGVPMTVKESFNVAGLPTTYGYEEHRHNVAQEDAVTVARLKRAGAVIFGKTNVPVSLADWQSFNPVYGTTRNPWDTSRTPGGSSGGSAAALAAGLSYLELGSDIGASIRNPAHYCGVWGHKPTWGTVPVAGHQLVPRHAVEAYDIAAVGPLARSAFDLSVALDIVSTPLQAQTALGPVPLAWRDRGVPLSRLRVALVTDSAEAPVDASVQASLQALGDFLRRQGVHVDEAARPVDDAESWAVYIHLLRSATGSREPEAVWADAGRRAAGFDADDTSYPARHFRAIASTHRDWVAMDERRFGLRHRWAAFFERFDLLICPAAPTPAFPHNQVGPRWERMVPVNGQGRPSTDGLYWAGYPGVVGLPATAVPIGLSPEGLPIGAQVVGPAYGDPECLRFARWLEREYRAFVPPPLQSRK